MSEHIMSRLTEDLIIGEYTYTLKTTLGWYDMQVIEQSGIRLFADGKSVSNADDIASIPMLEIKIDSAEATLRRLTTWLVGYKPIEVLKINPAHVPVLLARIAQLEEAQAEAVKALSDDHPLMKAANEAKRNAKDTATLSAASLETQSSGA